MTHLPMRSLAAAAALVLAGPALAQDGGRPISVMLTGEAESGPGDTDGAGTFEARINPGQGQLCYTLTVSNIATPTAAHIHIAPLETAGPVVVALATPATGRSEGCATVTREVAQALIRDPGAYYVNVHNAEFGPGAIRAQLAK